MMKTGMLDKETRLFLRKELKEYMKSIGEITASERKGLLEWVAAGRSVYDNPNFVYGENGWPLDYISAIRDEEELIRMYKEDGIDPWGESEGAGTSLEEALSLLNEAY